MAQTSHIAAAAQWVIDKYPYNSYHLLNALEWLDRIAPDAGESLRLATLTHDMERAFPGPDQPVAKSFTDAEYIAAHSERSARIVGAWLREQGAPEAVVIDVQELIRLHETGGTPAANLVQASDSLSLLDVNVDLFLRMVQAGKRSVDDIREKFDYTYDRIQVSHARELARPMYERAIQRLGELTDAGGGAGERRTSDSHAAPGQER